MDRRLIFYLQIDFNEKLIIYIIYFLYIYLYLFILKKNPQVYSICGLTISFKNYNTLYHMFLILKRYTSNINLPSFRFLNNE